VRIMQAGSNSLFGEVSEPDSQAAA
jgi:hypothetical protein